MFNRRRGVYIPLSALIRLIKGDSQGAKRSFQRSAQRRMTRNITRSLFDIFRKHR
ncbi:hypothetical protein [Natranaerobius trueperi]|uniref:hypothetical protein n=1 Tax=Natranaerobius trueperi TaxID=759412 RepID=UPI001303122B|nr:hypothetical protein [Natranaerobius trueperi]